MEVVTMSLKFTATKNFKQDFFIALNIYGISSTRELETAFYNQPAYSKLPTSLIDKYEKTFKYGAEDFNFTDFGGSDYHKQRGTPIGFRHIQVDKNAPRFEFLCGYMGGGDYPDVFSLFYLDEMGVPQLYFPVKGNPISQISGIAYQFDDIPEHLLNNDGDYNADFDEIRQDIIRHFSLDKYIVLKSN